MTPASPVVRVRLAFAVLLLCGIGAAGCATRDVAEPAAAPADWGNTYDVTLAQTLKQRDADWRYGPIIYQVIVDRFAPAQDLDAKRHLYPAPKTLHDWDEVPRGGKKLEELGLWTHEIAFWGGDLPSVRSQLDYIDALGVDVLYLNPIHAAYTNHKYDAQDYAAVSPEYGTRKDVAALARDCHARDMRLMLDGVFNHMGRTSPKFVDAMENARSRYKDWFVISDAYRRGYRGWYNVGNLPELNLENPAVRAHIWADRDSVVQSYLREGVDGWRLDVAYDIGPKYLAQLTAAARRARPDAWVIGEIWNYPEQWSPGVDGVMNFHLRQIVLDMLEGKITGRHGGAMIDRMIADAGLDMILKSWFQLDNHDTPRLKHVVPDARLRKMAMVLQFTLPGCPVIYYGSELGMDGGPDPANRAPMRWDLATDDNPDLQFTRQLIRLRKENRALRTGEWRVIDTEKLLAFSRQTDKADESVIVIANPTTRAVTEVFSPRDSKLMSGMPLRDQLDPSVEVRNFSGRIELEVPAKTVRVLKAVVPDNSKEYSPYKRVR